MVHQNNPTWLHVRLMKSTDKRRGVRQTSPGEKSSKKSESCLLTGSAKHPGVSSWLETHPAPEFIDSFPCGQSARSPSHTPRQDDSLQSGSFPIVSAALTGSPETNWVATEEPMIRQALPSSPLREESDLNDGVSVALDFSIRLETIAEDIGDWQESRASPKVHIFGDLAKLLQSRGKTIICAVGAFSSLFNKQRSVQPMGGRKMTDVCTRVAKSSSSRASEGSTVLK